MAADELNGEPQEPATIGQRLVQARTATGLSLADIASRTRVPIRHLQNIDEDNWDSLPAPTYAVGFVRSYAAAVGLDGAALGRELRQQLGAQVRRTPPPEYYEPADPARVPPRALAIAAAVIAVLLVVGYLLWRNSVEEGEAPSAPAAATNIPIEQALTGEAPPPAASQPVNGPVTVTATGEVWLKITDGPNGAVLFQGMLQPGQSFAVPADAQHPVLRTGRPQLLHAMAGSTDLGPIDTTEHVVSGVSLLAPDLAARARAAAAPSADQAPTAGISPAPGAPGAAATNAEALRPPPAP